MVDFLINSSKTAAATCFTALSNHQELTLTSSNLLSLGVAQGRMNGPQVRFELTLEGLLVYLAHHNTTQDTRPLHYHPLNTIFLKPLLWLIDLSINCISTCQSLF